MLMRVIEAELDSGVQESKGNLQARGEPGSRGSGAGWHTEATLGEGGSAPWSRGERGQSTDLGLCGWTSGSQGGRGVKGRGGSSHLLARPLAQIELQK